MKFQFLPITYSSFDLNGENYQKIYGRNEQGQKLCIIDKSENYLWAILKDKTSLKEINKLIEKIKKIKISSRDRDTKVTRVEIKEKNFLGKPVKALKIYATNYKDLSEIATKLDSKEIIKRRGYDLSQTTQYIIERKLEPMNWYELEGEILTDENLGGISRVIEADFVIQADSFKKIEKKLPEPKAMAYDLETDALEIGKGAILMVSLYAKDFQKVITWKRAKHTEKEHSSEAKKKCSPSNIRGSSKETKGCLSYVQFVKDEAELIEEFIKQVKEYSPDFLIGYNSDNFDMPYLKSRAEKNKIKLTLGLDNSIIKLSRGINVSARIDGITHTDLIKLIRTTYSQYMQSETMSLNEVSKEFLGDQKKDFQIQHSSKLDEKQLEKYYEYNLQDSKLTLELFLKFWPDLLEFSKVIKEPIFEISRNGLSKQIESYILHHLEKYNEIPERRPNHSEIGDRRTRGGVKGAFVYEPKPGLYENLAMFDFTSMHTSIIITHNISKATLEKKKTNQFKSPDIEMNNQQTNFYFSKKPNFFPTLLKDIFEKRKQYKEEYKKNPDKITKARSNAFKLLSASAHGYIGFFGARYYSWEASSTILAFVRKYNQDIIKDIEKQGHKIIYGDSVSGNTKIWVRENRKIEKIKIKDLFKNVDTKTKSNKEYNFKENIETLTIDEKGNSIFKSVPYIMRHKTNKKMYRIHFTNNWSIDVTEDHSLIGYQSTKFNQSKKIKPLNRLIEIKPTEIKKKTNSIISLKKIPLKNTTSLNYPKEVYEFLGFFIGDGSFSKNKSQKKDYCLDLSLGLDKKELLEKLISPLKEKDYLKNHWDKKNRKGDIKINGLKLIDLVAKHCKKDNKKVFPKFLFKEEEANIAAFLRGYFSADGTVMIRNNAPIIKLTSINKEFIEKTRDLLFRIGISNSVFKENKPNFYNTKEKIYSNGSISKNIIIKNKEQFMEKIGFILERKNKRGKIKTNGQQKKLIKNFEFDLQSVVKVEKIKTPKYVYDVEVEDTHRFFANNCLVHNTDSVAFTVENKTNSQIKKLLENLNKKLPGVMHLESEGFFKRGLWVTTRSGETGAKKKYAMINEKGEVKIRGFETVRRDWCKLARKVQDKIIRLILKEGSEKKALEYLKKVIKDLKERKIPLEELTIKTQLKKPIESYKAISPHVVAARKMIEQNIPVGEGGLIEYYLGESKTNSKLVRDKVKLISEKGEYNLEYYLNKQLLPAVENIFHVFGIEIKDIIEGNKQEGLNKWF